MKRCIHCGETKPLDAFPAKKNYCRACHNAQTRAYTARNKDKLKERRMAKQPPTALTLSSGWVKENIGPISVRIARAEFLSNPPQLQEQRRERVRELLIKERLRGQKSPSYLARHAREIYGI